jgi:hypothetical protein
MEQEFSTDEYKNKPLLNIGTGKDISIKELALIEKAGTHA